MLLSKAYTVLDLQGPEALRRYSFTGIDLDMTCARMFPLQFLGNVLVHQIEIGEVVSYHGNALASPNDLTVVVHSHGRSYNPATVPAADAPERIEAIQQVAVARAYTNEDQIALF